jgi:CHASE3 domain sensor protein
MTEEEKMERIRAFLADDYLEKLHALIEARKKELVQEIAATSDPQKKEHLQRNLTLLSNS